MFIYFTSYYLRKFMKCNFFSNFKIILILPNEEKRRFLKLIFPIPIQLFLIWGCIVVGSDLFVRC